MITTETLRLCMPDAAPQHIAEYTPHIDTAMTEVADISTPVRMAMFIASIGHESGSLRRITENLNYGAEALVRVWPNRFRYPLPGERTDLALFSDGKANAQVYARQSEMIANRVYADRMGNGPEESGDGWRYAGAGLIQLTGKENQERCAEYFNIPLEGIGDWLRTPEGASRSAGWYWWAHNLNTLADAGNFLRVSQRINGSGARLPNGWPDREKRWERAKGVLGLFR